jgi:hypothetical protein
MMKIPQMLHQMIAARESLVANTIAARDSTWKFGHPDAMDGRLVALKIGETCEVCGRGAAGDFAGPCSVKGWIS